MNYPLITEYIDAILQPENFEELADYIPVLNLDGKPIMSTGNFSVVFKMVDSKGGIHAVKCFTKDQDGREDSYIQIAEELEYVSSNYMTSVKYLPNELFVSSKVTNQTEFPVVVMDWVEGLTLQEALEKDLSKEHIYSLLYQFSKMAMWLLSQPFSHGDIKPDNVIVRDDNSIVLVDYDGMYVPSMKGKPSRESGTPDYRHPNRITNNIYDEHIDDFAISVIILSLLIIYDNNTLYIEKGDKEGLLFSECDFYDIESCTLYIEQKYKHNTTIWNQVFNVFENCLSSGFLTKEQASLLRIPEIYDDNIIQGEKASLLITKILWKIAHNDYLLHVNLTEGILSFENKTYNVECKPFKGRLGLSSSINGYNLFYSYTMLDLQKLLIRINMWDSDIKLKFELITSNAVILNPELMVRSTEVFFENYFADISHEISISSIGHTLTIVSNRNINSLMIQESIFFMLSNETFQKNCKRFGIQKVLMIDSQSGNQEFFKTKNN